MFGSHCVQHFADAKRPTNAAWRRHLAERLELLAGRINAQDRQRLAVSAVTHNLAIRADDLSVTRAFRLYPDGTGDDGEGRTKFRAWKQSLLGRE